MIKILFLGGVGELGKSCYAIEYENDIIVLDCGLLNTRMTLLGTIYTMPDISYLKNKKEHVRGCVISRAHPSHSGFASLIESEIGAPLYATEETSKFINAKTVSIKNPVQRQRFDTSPITINKVEYGRKIICGSLAFSLFKTAPDISEATGITIHTPLGDIVFANTINPEVDTSLFPQKPLALMLDSVFAEKRSEGITEKDIEETIVSFVRSAQGRVIFPTTSVQASRVAKIIDLFSNDRIIAVEGNDLLNRLDVVRSMGGMKTKQENILTLKNASEHIKFDTAIIIMSGTMEDPYTPLTYLAEGEHPHIKINENDTILTPNTAFIGYERIIQNLYGRLSHFGAIIEFYSTDDMGKISHAKQPKIIEIVKKVAPVYFIPVNGYHYMLTASANNAQQYGIDDTHTLIPNQGDIVVISKDGMKRSKEKIESELTTFEHTSASTEGLGQVIADRKVLEENGFFYIVIKIDHQKKSLRKSPDILTRGFIYIRESQDLIQKIRLLIKKIVETDLKSTSREDIDELKKIIKKEVSSFLKAETDKRPFVFVDADIV